MGDNSKPKGTCDECITGTVKVFTNLAKKCPSAKFMFMGYSQGGALMSNAIPLLPADVRARTIAGVFFGSTRGSIANFPKDNLLQLCAGSDNVCVKRGSSGSSGSHLSYSSNGDIEKAADFLAKKIASGGGRGGKGGKRA
jgi:cutinase